MRGLAGTAGIGAAVGSSTTRRPHASTASGPKNQQALAQSHALHGSSPRIHCLRAEERASARAVTRAAWIVNRITTTATRRAAVPWPHRECASLSRRPRTPLGAMEQLRGRVALVTGAPWSGCLPQRPPVVRSRRGARPAARPDRAHRPSPPARDGRGDRTAARGRGRPRRVVHHMPGLAIPETSGLMRRRCSSTTSTWSFPMATGWPGRTPSTSTTSRRAADPPSARHTGGPFSLARRASLRGGGLRTHGGL